MKEFSIVTPIHKIPETFIDCISSLESQEISFEWIIILNGDIKDEEVERALINSSIKDQVLLTRSNGPQGPSHPRNVGINKARGEYIIFLDSDDCLAKEFLLNLSKKIHKIDDRSFAIAANGKRFNKHKKSIGKNNLIFNDGMVSGAQCSVNYIGSISGFCISKNSAVRFNEKLTFFEDFDLYLKLHNRCIPIYRFEDVIYFYCVSDDSVTGQISHNLDLIKDARKIILRETVPQILNLYYRFLVRLQLYRLQQSHSQNNFMLFVLSFIIFLLYPLYFKDFLRRLLTNLNFK